MQANEQLLMNNSQPIKSIKPNSITAENLKDFNNSHVK